MLKALADFLPPMEELNRLVRGLSASPIRFLPPMEELNALSNTDAYSAPGVFLPPMEELNGRLVVRANYTIDTFYLLWRN